MIDGGNGPSMQATLFDLGPRVVPFDLRSGSRNPRRSTSRAWKLFVALERAADHSLLAKAWDECTKARMAGHLDDAMHELLSESWARRSKALRGAKGTRR